MRFPRAREIEETIGEMPVVEQAEVEGDRGGSFGTNSAKTISRVRNSRTQRIATLGRGGDRTGKEVKGPIDLLVLESTQSEAAELLNVSEKSVKRARLVETAGAEELVKAVEDGRRGAEGYGALGWAGVSLNELGLFIS